jgi:ergothioneine biosynthesis protein EgtB
MARDRQTLLDQYLSVRQTTLDLCRPLQIEDYVVQAMPDASPAKWHLGHTAWFFEKVILCETAGYRPFDERYHFLFNSYYHAFGPRWARDQRGALSRPTVREVLDYRRHVDTHLVMLAKNGGGAFDRAAPLVEIGIHHEQQHQELLLTDVKAALAQCPLHPVYRAAEPDAPPPSARAPGGFTRIPAGKYTVGHPGDGFAYDNECPAHTVWLEAFELRDTLVTNGEFLEFLRDGGYRRPELWLSDGWDTVQGQGWEAPLYWSRAGESWNVFTLSGLRPLDVDAPACHVSFFEADAFARWKGLRLPTEEEWEVAACPRAAQGIAAGSFLEGGRFQPAADGGSDGLRQMYGEVWQWTASAYLPYPGYRPLPGPLGEYNGKFMNGQYVLRGGSCATPRSHLRPTYRNFFQPDKRWQFTGIRLAR